MGEETGRKKSLGFPSGGGEMGERIRVFDWSSTPLGPIEKWPQSLRTSVSLILNSRHPMWMGWGPEITFLYNDAYLHVLGLAKHPWALGRPASEVWAEIWDVCGPLAEQVFRHGEASFVDDVRLFMNRGDYLEETYYSFSYSPIQDESGNVAGLFCPSNDVTPKVLNARRLGTLSELAGTALVERSTEAACASAARALASNPDDIPFSLLYLIDGESKHALLAETTGLSAQPSIISPASLDVSGGTQEGQPWPIAEVIASAQSRVVSVQHLDGLPLGPAEQPMSEAAVLPVTSYGQDRPAGVLIAGVNPTRKLDTEYHTFLSLVASQVATAIQNARTYEEERERAEALAELDRAKTTFFSNVSHELRTPLTLMLGPVEDLLSKETISGDDREHLEMVNRNSLRLLKLVNNLLDFSRIEAGRVEAMYEPTDLAAYTADLASSFRSAIEKAGMRLSVSCPPLGQRVYIDRGMWEKIVLNLLSNAFKFTLAGEISVSLGPAGEHVEMSVRDTGVGIPPEEIPHLFERFRRAKGVEGRTYEGTGIGLALVQELVRMHGGTIRVDSEPGKGSTFTVSIPHGHAHLPADHIRAQSGQASTAMGATAYVEEALRWLPDSGEGGKEAGFISEALPEGARPAGEGGQLAKILVADDNADLRDYVRHLLQGRYEVAVVDDGQAALEAALDSPPDLILTDIMMPRMDGLELVRQLRADPTTREVPLILLSARAGEESRVEGIDTGADDYLVKPFSARELIARVEGLLELARVRHEATESARESEERLRLTMEAASTGTWQWDLVAGVLTWDTMSSYLFGLPTDTETRYEVFENALHPDDRQRVSAAVKASIDSELDYDTEYRMVWPDGSIHWMHARGRGTYDASGKATRLVGTVTDITERKHAEEALRESERLYKAIGESIDYGVWVCDPDGRNIYASESFLNLVGITQQQCSEFGWGDVLHPDDAERTIAAWKECVRTEGKWDIEHRFRGVDGRWHPILARGLPVRDEQGRITCWAGINLDIGSLKQTEEALRESEERMRLLGDNLPDSAVYQYTYDSDGTPHFLYVSSGIERLNGVKVEDVLRDAMTLHRQILPEYYGALLEAEAASARDLSDFNMEVEMRRSNGEVRWMALRSRPRRLPDGRVVWDGVQTDSTERKQAEDELREFAARLNSYVENSPLAVMEWDQDLRITRWAGEAEKVFGWSADEVVGRKFSEFAFAHEDDEAAWKLIPEMLSGSMPRTTSTNRNCRKDGSVITCEWYNSVISSEGDGKVSVLSLALDITDRVEMQRQREDLLAREHRIAETLQQALIPAQIPTTVSGCHFAAKYVPALAEAEVGGDFYDVFDLGDGRVAVLIGDVAGKGVRAAMQVSAARYAFRSYAYIESSPSRVVRLVNDALCMDQGMEVGLFTAFFAVVDTRSRTITYTNAGHEPPVVRRECGRVEELNVGGRALGVLPDCIYPEGSLKLDPGDVIVMVTDGITEARSDEHGMFGKSKMLRFIADENGSPSELIDRLFDKAKEYGNGHLQDDVAIVALGLETSCVEAGRDG